MSNSLANIPNSLKLRPQWVVWRYETITDTVSGETRKTKVPRQCNGGARARSNDPKTCSTFEAAVEALESSPRYAGIGYIISEDDPFTGIDLDSCVATDGTLEPWAQAIVDKFNSYAEFSPSGKGVHILIEAVKPGLRCRTFEHPNIEIYDKLRFLAITGNKLPNSSADIEPSALELSNFYKELFGDPDAPLDPVVKRRVTSTQPSNLSDWELVEKAKISKHGAAFSALWYGDTSLHNNDMSAASLALCNHLAFWTQDDPDRMDRLFRQSGLMRDKWDKKRPGGTWGSMTIARAIADPHEIYTPVGATSKLDKAIAENCSDEELDEVRTAAKAAVRASVKNGNSNTAVTVTTIAKMPTTIINPDAPNFDSLLPPRTYLDSYVKFASELTDAPREFHLTAGLVSIAAALGNTIYINAWGQHVYPNLWMLMLAPSGFYRKSTAINIGLRVLYGKCEDVVMPNDFTREKLIECLDNQPFGVIGIYEFGDLLAQMQREYNCGLKEFLTNIYDGHPFKRATKRETSRIENAALSIIAASTIDWIHDRITEGDVRGGFLARFLFWPSTEKNGWMGLDDWKDDSQFSFFQGYLGSLRNLPAGPIKLSKEAMSRYNQWNRAHEEEINDQKLPSEIQGFYTRMATYALKLGMIYQITIEVGAPMVVTLEALEYGIRVIEYLKTKLLYVIREELTTTRDARDLKRIKELVEREPGITRSKLLTGSHFIAKRLDDLLVTLIEAGQITAQSVKNGSKKPKQVFYISDGEADE